MLKFLKNWTLPFSMLTGTMLYLLFASVPQLDAAASFFDGFLQKLLPVVMFMVLFTNFCKADFHKMRLLRWHVVLFFLQLVLMALLLVPMLWLHPEAERLVVMEAVLMCVICPCAAAAPVVASKLGGQLEAMTTYSCLSNLLTAFIIPSALPLVDLSTHISFGAAFFSILQRVVMVLIGPMLLAYFVKHWCHRLHAWLLSMGDLSFYLWACCLAIVAGTTLKHILHAQTTGPVLLLIALSALLCCLVQFALGRALGRSMGVQVECGQGLGQKNTAFAIWIASAYLNPLSTVGPGCYILWQNIVNSWQLWKYRLKGERRA